MTTRISKTLLRFLAPIAIALATPIIELAAWLVARLPLPAVGPGLARRHGVHLLRRHYYSPIPDPSDFRPGFWDEESELVGLDLREEAALALMQEVFPRYLSEFRERFPVTLDEQKTDPRFKNTAFHLLNGLYMAVDAHVYYCLIRHHQPRRIIEIGSGQSTLLAVAAAAKNQQEDDAPCSITAIEPHPSPALEALPEGAVTLMRRKLQDVKWSFFEALEEDDILFIDSTHVLREGNDVQLEYLEILPRLKPGVRVHIHDISLPRRYPSVYFEQSLFWNEQYLLQAYLTHNRRMEIVWPGNYMMLRHSDEMMRVFPEIAQMRALYPMSEPTAFWMRVKD